MSEKEILIRQAAIEEFRTYGYDGARLERIAQKAGVRPTLIHYYFRGKKNLYEAVKDALDTSIPWEMFQEALQAPASLVQRVELFYQAFAHWITPSRAIITSQAVEKLQNPSLLEQMQQAQQLGLLRPLPPTVILYLLWCIAWIPLATSMPHPEWEKFYRQAPALFWDLLR
ncbi:MAG: TetR/AcrR family transcriptional regulator [Bacteroidia bacterium]